MTDGKSETDSLKVGFGIWMAICFLICLWFWKSFAKGRQQFQTNLHIIEDGLRRMQERMELKQRQNSMGCIEDVEDLSTFMEKFRQASGEDEEQNDNAIKEESEDAESQEQVPSDNKKDV